MKQLTLTPGSAGSKATAAGRYSGATDVTSAESAYDGGHSPMDEYDASKKDIAADFVDRPEKMRFEGDEQRFVRAVQRSYRNLENYREVNRKLVEEYGGTYYHSDNAEKTHSNRHVNLIQQTVEAYQMLLAANQPKVMIRTPVERYRAFAKHFQYALNDFMGEIGIQETLNQWVMDAFFCVGIVKTHLADAGVVEIETDRWMDPGKPFASNIALDDFVYDTKANKWSEVRYAGDMYSLSFEQAIDLFGADKMSKHVPRARTTDDIDRVEELSRGYDSDTDDLEDRIDLADIWFPDHGVIYTYVVQSRRSFLLHSEPVAVEEWTGDEHGPYHLLGFGDVPENIMPASPASHLHDLDALVNDMWRKCSRQARRQKDVILYTSAGAATAQQIQRSDDGELVHSTDPAEISIQKHGGVDAGSYAFLTGAMSTFDRMAGNLAALSGLGAQTGTVGQEQLVNDAVSNRIDKMTNVVVGATNRLVKALGLMLWQDDFKEMVLEIPLPGTSITATSTWKPGDREGNFLDYNFDIDVYSMQYQSPSSKLSQLNTLIQGTILPMAPFLQQQGGMIDMFELTRTFSELMNMPELNHIVRFQGVSTTDALSATASAEIPRKAPNSTRNYVRTNVSAGDMDPMGQSASLMSQAAAAGPATPGGMT